MGNALEIGGEERDVRSVLGKRCAARRQSNT